MKIMKKNITLVTIALLLGTQSIMGSLGLPDGDSFELADGNSPYFSLLNDEDKAVYRAMQAEFREFRNRQNKKSSDFSQVIDQILGFVEGVPNRMWARASACGIIQLDRCLVKNDQTLEKFLDKTILAIRDAFSALGYSAVKAKDIEKPLREFLGKIPPAERRQWTVVRKRVIRIRKCEETETFSTTTAQQQPPIVASPLHPGFTFQPADTNGSQSTFDFTFNYSLWPPQSVDNDREEDRRDYPFGNHSFLFPNRPLNGDDFGTI
jgi:hypothetical protein